MKSEPMYNVSRSVRTALLKLRAEPNVIRDVVLTHRIDAALRGDIHWSDLLGELGDLLDTIDVNDNTITN